MRFQFDPRKASSNLKKHGIYFADAEGVFFDSLDIHQPDSNEEDKERFIGMEWEALANSW